MRTPAAILPLTPCALAVLVGLLCPPGAVFAEQAAADSPSPLVLHVRSRIETPAGSGQFRLVEREIRWEAARTAVVVGNMWNEHWCRGATRRITELAPRIQEVVAAARAQGALIIHCPASCMEAYKDSPMRKRAQEAPKVDSKLPPEKSCPLDPQRERALPIDDSDGGCDCWPRCAHGSPWRRQIEAIPIDPADAVTDSAEALYLMKQRGIQNVLIMGVHANLSLLERPFAIRQMVYQGQNVVLLRDLTDTMYNSRMSPFVPHVQGTELVLEHVEKYWCPTALSTDLTGKPAFRFREAALPHAVFVISEPEFQTETTLPQFAQQELVPRGIRCTFVFGDPKDGSELPGIEALKSADLLVLSVRRRAPPEAHLQLIRDYLETGKPLVAIRSASHAFHTRGQHPEGRAEWQEFDPHVLGGNYTGQHEEGPQVSVMPAPPAAGHPILQEVDLAQLRGFGALYKVSPLAPTTTLLLTGAIPAVPAEPLAWTHSYHEARVFYTSLGHPRDFEQPAFRQLLTNAVFWGLAQPVPGRDIPPQLTGVP